MTEVDGTAHRRRGRRPHSVAESAQVRERILSAFTDQFAHTGYHGLTVALVLDRAGISRGTYYRYFRDLDEPLLELLARFRVKLMDLVATPLREGDLPMTKITGAVDGYLEWGRRERMFLPALAAGMHETGNPIAKVRTEILATFAGLLREQFAGFGLAPPEPDTLDVFLYTLEFTVYNHYLTHPVDDDEALARARATMLKTAIALLTPPSAWNAAAEALGVTD